MKTYISHRALISLHIPKCAGQSFRNVLEKFFPGRIFFHYYQQRGAPPLKHSLGPGICIHGHFNSNRNFGVYDYYPQADQFMTLLRDPLEAAISNYFYWKTKARAVQLEKGMITEGAEHDYRNIDDFFIKRPCSNMLDFMPANTTRESYKEMIETRFIWIGLVENFQRDVNRLSALLDCEPVQADQLNSSLRDESLSSHLRDKFVEQNALPFEIYNYVKQLSETKAAYTGL